MDRKDLLIAIKQYYIQERVNQVDKDFLEYEEDMANIKDLEKVLELLEDAKSQQ